MNKFVIFSAAGIIASTTNVCASSIDGGININNAPAPAIYEELSPQELIELKQKFCTLELIENDIHPEYKEVCDKEAIHQELENRRLW